MAYPFERLNNLLAPLTPNSNFTPISLSIGEPKHQPPDFALEILSDQEKVRALLATYPSTKGTTKLRQSISTWLKSRFSLEVDYETEILPVNGTREALFSFAQAVISDKTNPIVIMPNPFYQIYEGAALLAGASTFFCSSFETNNYLQDFESIPSETWRNTELIYICSPANPTGKSLSDGQIEKLIDLAHQYDFTIASDECYSEIYSSSHNKPNSLLKISENIGNKSFEKCIIFHSLSKRSNLPGLRSGFVAGDSNLLKQYFLYRTYHGCAMAGHAQEISALAWSDESHVDENRDKYTEKFSVVEEILKDHYKLYRPEGGFYHWIKTPIDDQQFAARLMETHNVKVMPGSFLSREDNGEDPGLDHIRVAWVSEKEECIEAARRLVEFARGL
jgi:N-succinyldiaminopimelate aminotransferase|tara:strand:+ start:1672 stop:2844 length:1173 start_codon:yes stop_codon:yes gene_type:complete